ncbi:MAG TPA: glycosyltransferase family 2 protein [Longimicrobiaceae bacterium]|nr:glycosyltransferase family 2 protein [Longimicrobiaceae bacterium]
MPRVSVVVPAYNYGRYLREAIESIQVQDVDDLEIVVVDNGSTDDTRDVLASIDEPRMRVITLEVNQGLSGAFNRAMEEVRGEYVAYLDADDRWRPGKLSRQLELMESEPEVGVVFCNFAWFDEQGVRSRTQFDIFPRIRDIPTVPTRAGGGRRITGDAFTTFVEFADPPVWLQSMLFRREVLDGIGLAPGMRLAQDTHFGLRVYRRTVAAYIEDALVEVRRHGSNLTRDISEMKHAKLRAFRMLEEEPLTPEQRAALRRRIGCALVDSGQAALKQRRPLLAVQAFGRALGYSGVRARALKNLLGLPVHPVLFEDLRGSVAP